MDGHDKDSSFDTEVSSEGQSGQRLSPYCLAEAFDGNHGRDQKLYKRLERNGLLVIEQNGCRKETRGTKDQLLLGKTVLKKCQERLKNVSMTWIHIITGLKNMI